MLNPIDSRKPIRLGPISALTDSTPPDISVTEIKPTRNKLESWFPELELTQFDPDVLLSARIQLI